MNINIHVTGSLCCTAETNTTLLSNCTPIKINKYKIKFRKTKRNDKLKKKKNIIHYCRVLDIDLRKQLSVKMSKLSFVYRNDSTIG